MGSQAIIIVPMGRDRIGRPIKAIYTLITRRENTKTQNARKERLGRKLRSSKTQSYAALQNQDTIQASFAKLVP